MKNTKEFFDPTRAIYTPPETAAYGAQFIARLKEQKLPGLSLGIPEIKDYMPPILPGELAIMIAQTSNYKSGFFHHIEENASRQLEREGREEILIHISVEEGIESQAVLLLSRESGNPGRDLARGIYQDWNRLEQAAIRIGTIPIYRIGESLARAEDMPFLTISNMVRAIKLLASGEITGKPLKIAGLFFDYLQAFPADPEAAKFLPDKQRRMQVYMDVKRLRQAARYFECPVWVAVQAREVLKGAPGRNMLIPGIYDGQESSFIAQHADRVCQGWMPKTTHPVGEMVIHKGVSFQVDENLFFFKVGKQKNNLPAGRSWKCRIDFQRNIIAPEIDFEETNDYARFR